MSKPHHVDWWKVFRDRSLPVEEQLGFGEKLTQPLQRSEGKFRALCRKQGGAQRTCRHSVLTGLSQAFCMQRVFLVVGKMRAARAVNFEQVARGACNDPY